MRFSLLPLLCILMELSATPIRPDEKAMLYLQKYGYLEEATNIVSRTGSAINEEDVEEALKDFQRFAGLQETGLLDSDTVRMMNTPRCGVKDFIGHAAITRKKRYAHQGSKWDKKHLTYRITKYPSRLREKHKVDKEITRAFKVWSDVTDLTFEHRKRGSVNIEIRFVVGEHGDGEPFDGPNGTLAHGFFPQFGGDVHFDDDENWSLSKGAGTNVFEIAAHEFGHSLGLAHSEDWDSVMSPYYQKSGPSFKLSKDDVRGIQSIYGSGPNNMAHREAEEYVSGAPPDTSGAPDICQDSTMDTITQMQNDTTYVFKGEFYWKLLSDGMADGYPRKISDDWDNLEGNLDASLSWPNGKTFFFKGNRYWRFSNKKMDPDFPKVISVGFEGIPDLLDAALVWSGNGKSYFFKGDQYWQYDSHRDPPVSRKYPRPLSNWVGIPNNLDAAFLWGNSKSYFFKGKDFYRFNDASFAVDSGTPPYPRKTADWWFGC